MRNHPFNQTEAFHRPGQNGNTHAFVETMHNPFQKSMDETGFLDVFGNEYPTWAVEFLANISPRYTQLPEVFVVRRTHHKDVVTPDFVVQGPLPRYGNCSPSECQRKAASDLVIAKRQLLTMLLARVDTDVGEVDIEDPEAVKMFLSPRMRDFLVSSYYAHTDINKLILATKAVYSLFSQQLPNTALFIVVEDRHSSNTLHEDDPVSMPDIYVGVLRIPNFGF